MSPAFSVVMSDVAVLIVMLTTEWRYDECRGASILSFAKLDNEMVLDLVLPSADSLGMSLSTIYQYLMPIIFVQILK